MSFRGEGRSALVVDGQPAFAHGLATLVTDLHYRAIVCDGGLEALAAAEVHGPDLVMLGLRVRSVDPPEMCASLRRCVPGLRAAIFFEAGDGERLDRCRRAIPSVTVLRDASVEEIRAALSRLRGGLLERADMDTPQVVERDLSAQERRIVELVGRGLTSREVAAVLDLAPNTIRSYCQSILTKLGARNRAHAVEIARDRGLIATGTSDWQNLQAQVATP